jgi:hypothetical protein
MAKGMIGEDFRKTSPRNNGTGGLLRFSLLMVPFPPSIVTIKKKKKVNNE